ncbi:hypothetical protein [Anaerobiospirillum succiniciproducens]|uniref:hypothetical protein n=1 Tax=Anaerobiospirillum succiniciproducens TaxID=13335 RepID=UPI003F8C6E0F
MAKKSRAEKFAERAAAEAAAAQESASKHMSKYALKKIAQQNAERSGTVYISAGAKAKEAEDLAAEQAKIRALTEDPDLIEHDLPATDRSYANVAKAAMEGANLIENPQKGTPVEINYEGKTVTVYLRPGESDVPEKILVERYKKELRRKAIRDVRKQTMARMRKAGTVRGKGSKTRVVIPKKLELERQIIETFGVETRDRLPDLYDPQERLSSTYKHNQLGQMLMSPIKRFLPPVVGRDPLAAYLDKWAKKIDTQGIFADAFAKIKHIRRHEDGFARVGLIAFLKFVEGLSKNTIIDDYAFDQHLYIKRREVTSFINTMKEPALRWAKQRHKYENNYAFVYFDTYPIHIKLGKRRTICIQLLLSIGVTLDGRKDLLAAIPDLTSGRLTVVFWEKILENFKNLGMQNICFVVASARCRYLDLAVNNIFPEATMHYNLQEVLQLDSYALEAPHRKEFMADVAKLLECENFDLAREQLSALRDKWEPLMEDSHVILQGNIEYLRVHTLLSNLERRVFSSQKTVSSAASLLLGLKASDDFFSDNAEIIVYIFYRYLLIAKPYWFEHQDEAVNNLTYSRIFTTLRQCDVPGAILLNRLLGEQHESFMLRHFGSFGNGPVFNLNPARKRISLSGHIDNNTYAQQEADGSKTNAIGSAPDYISAALSSNDVETQATEAEDAANTDTAQANDAAATDTAVASETSNEAPALLSPAEKALQSISNYERKYNAFAQEQANDSQLSSSLTLLSSTQSAVIPYENNFVNPFSSAAANSMQSLKAKSASTKSKSEEDANTADEHSSTVPSRLAQAVFKENRVNFSGSFNGLDLSALNEYAQICPLNLISGSLSPLSNTIDGTFGFTSVAVRPEMHKVHKSSAVREALSFEFNAASKAAAEAKVAAAKAEKAAKIAAKEEAQNFGVQVVSATLLDKDSGESLNELIEESKTLKLDVKQEKAAKAASSNKAKHTVDTDNKTTDAASYERVYTETTHDEFAIAKVAQNNDVAVSYSVDDDNGSGEAIRPDETLRSQDDYEEFKNVKSNIQTANTVLGMLRPSVARALRDDRIELKKAEREVIYECLGEDFDFAKIENVAHTITPIFRTTMHAKNIERRNKRAEEKKLARKEPRRRAHLNYLKRKAKKEAIAKDEARFGPYSSDALIPVNTVKDSAPKSNVLSDSSFGAEVKNIDSIVKDTGGFDANRVIAKTDFSSGSPATKVQLSAAERNLTASAKDMFTLLDKFDPNEGQIGSLTLNTTPVATHTTSGLNITSLAQEVADLSISSVAASKAKSTRTSRAKKSDLSSEIVNVVADAIDSGDAQAANTDDEAQKKRPRARRAIKPSVKATVAAIEADVKRKQAQKAKALENDGSIALKNAAKVSAKDLNLDAESTLNITPVADAEVQVVPAPLRNRIYEEFNMTPGIKTEKPQRVNLKKTKKSTTK